MKVIVFLLLAGLLAAPSPAQDLGPCTIETIAGSDAVFSEGAAALEAELLGPVDVRRAPDGSLWISEAGHQVIRRIGADGTLHTVVGTGAQGYAGDGGPAAQALLNRPRSMVFTPEGVLYFYEASNQRIRRVGLDGVIETVAGSGSLSFTGEDVPALQASFDGTVQLALEPSGEIVFTVSGDHRVRRLTSESRVVTIAGFTDPISSVGGVTGDGGPALDAALDRPGDIAVAADGTIFIADGNRRLVRRILPSGVIDTYLQRGNIESPDGTPRKQAVTEQVSEIELDPEGRLYWLAENSIRRISTDGLLETVVELDIPFGHFAIQPDGTIHFAGDERVYRLEGGDLVPIAGVGVQASRGDGGRATAARLSNPSLVSVGPQGEVYILDSSLNRVRVAGTDGVIRNFAGTGARGFTPQDGPAAEAGLQFLSDITAGPDGSLYLAASGFGWLGRVDPGGMLSTITGPASNCPSDDCGDGGLASSAQVPSIRQVEVDSQGNVYLLHSRRGFTPQLWLRRIRPDGVIEALPTALPGGEVAQPVSAIALDHDDHLIVSMERAPQSTLSDTGSYWKYHPETGWARIAESETGLLVFADRFAVGRNDGLYVVESVSSLRIRRWLPDGVLTTIAGGSRIGFLGDGGPARDARFRQMSDLAFDAAGNLYIADVGNQRIRRVNRAADCAAAPQPLIAFGGVRHAANYSTFLAPGTIFTIFGRGLGPAELTAAQLDGDRFPTELENVRVTVNGIPSPLIYVSAGQLSGIIPYAARNDDRPDPQGVSLILPVAHLRVENRGVFSDEERVGLRDASPGIFSLDSSGAGQGAILNQDGSLNGSLNPAAPGSVIVFYATGEGLTDPPSEDGKIAATPLPKPKLPVTAKIRGIEAEILYAGAAPGLTAGVMQVNVRIPENLPQLGAAGIELIVGERSSGASIGVVVGF